MINDLEEHHVTCPMSMEAWGTLYIYEGVCGILVGYEVLWLFL